MYLATEPNLLHTEYFGLIRELTAAAPSFTLDIDMVNSDILGGDYYGALKRMMKIIDKETALLDNALKK